MDKGQRATLAAQTSIGARTIESWDGTLVRLPRVLVPVQLDALVVREAGGRWAACAPRYVSTPRTGGRWLNPHPFEERTGREPGVYLHWALPSALSRAATPAEPLIEREPAPTVLPVIPDRWLVLRLSPAPQDSRRRAVAGWMLETGQPRPVVTPLDAWRDSRATPAPGGPRSVLGMGDPTWAAYFDNVENRLGFYDNLAGVAAGPLAYLICGWYSNPAEDILANPDVASPGDWIDLLRALGWRINAGDLERALQAAATYGRGALLADLPLLPDEAGRWREAGAKPFWPAASLFHGAAVGLGWPAPLPGVLKPDGRQGEAGGPPAPAAISVVIGATLAEAVGAAVAARGTPAAERAVEALYHGALALLGQADGPDRLDAMLHATTFASFPGERPPSAGPVVPPIGPRPGQPPPSPGRPPAGTLKIGAIPFRRARDELLSTPAVPSPFDPAGPVGPVIDPVLFKRPPARWFLAGEPVVLIQGAGRSFKHGADGRFDEGLQLPCRLSGDVVFRLGARGALPGQGIVAVDGGDLLERGVEHGGVPPECEELLRETALLDPGSAGAAAHRVTPQAVDEQARLFVIEQTAWWALRDPEIERRGLLKCSHIEGRLPSPVAMTMPAQPWLPRHLDWQVEFVPSPNGLRGWVLDSVDYRPGPDAFGAGQPATISGRAAVTGGAARALAAAVRQAIEQVARSGGAGQVEQGAIQADVSDEASALLADLQAAGDAAAAAEQAGARGRRALLEDIVQVVERMDVLAGALDGVRSALRAQATVSSGRLRLVRLRLVDGYGQFIDLVQPEAQAAKVMLSENLAIPTLPGHAALPPRPTDPARLQFQFLKATRDAALRDEVLDSPLCGFVQPNYIDGALEFYAADGSHLGRVMPDPRAGTVWESAPGKLSLVGQSLQPVIENVHLRRIAEGILAWGARDATGEDESALNAMLRLIDATLWAIRPYGSTGNEHLSLLTGHPLAVIRGRAFLESSGARPLPALEVQLGSLASEQDGLLGYFADDNYSQLCCVHRKAAALARTFELGKGFLGRIDHVGQFAAGFADDLERPRSPITHPFVNPHGRLLLSGGQPRLLTLLVEPYSTITITSGILPRKVLSLPRHWLVTSLSALAPVYRVGPVLVHPGTVRLPVPTEHGGSWSWSHRQEVSLWAEEQVAPATGDALIGSDPVEASEGWLRLNAGLKPGQENGTP